VTRRQNSVRPCGRHSRNRRTRHRPRRITKHCESTSSESPPRTRAFVRKEWQDGSRIAARYSSHSASLIKRGSRWVRMDQQREVVRRSGCTRSTISGSSSRTRAVRDISVFHHRVNRISTSLYAGFNRSDHRSEHPGEQARGASTCERGVSCIALY